MHYSGMRTVRCSGRLGGGGGCLPGGVCSGGRLPKGGVHLPLRDYKKLSFFRDIPE